MQKLTNEKARELLKELQYAKVQMGGQLSIRDEYFKQALEKVPRWIACSERMPDSNQTVQFYVADDKAIKQGRFISDSWHQEQDWCESSYGGMIDSEVCGNITHWMPLPETPL